MTEEEKIENALRQSRTIVCIGASLKPQRPSYYVSEYLVENGYRVIPVNPGHVGKTWLNEKFVGSLQDISKEIKIDMVDVFLRPEKLPEIIRATAMHLKPSVKFVWTQLDVIHPDAQSLGQELGLTIIENRCPKIELPKLLSKDQFNA